MRRETSPGAPAGAAAGTKARVLDAAEDLFGRHGYAATTLRAVTEAAGANVAAVNYHVGSKEDLLRAVVGRAARELGAERDRLLAGAGPAPEHLVRAYVTAGAGRGPRFRRAARLLGRLACDPDPAVRAVPAQAAQPWDERFLAALGAALPALGAPELAFRYRAMADLVALRQCAAAPPGDGEAERLVALLAAAFRAPPADRGDARA
jgi:AcrR family transcriptional regulator